MPGRAPRRRTCCRRPGSATPRPGVLTPPSRPSVRTPTAGAAKTGRAGGAAVSTGPRSLGDLDLPAGAGPDGTVPQVLFCENETNTKHLFGSEPITPYPKDGINDHVIHGASTVNPERTGTKCAFWYQVTVAPGQTAELRLRLQAAKASRATAAAVGAPVDRGITQRRAGADGFYTGLAPREAGGDEATVMREA